MKRKSIRDYLLLSWMIPFGFAIAGSAILSLGLAAIDYSSAKKVVVQRLEHDGQAVARRIAAELFLKDQGRVYPVIENLKSEFKLSYLNISTNDQQTVGIGSGIILVKTEAPGVLPRTYVWLAAPGPHFLDFMNYRNFLFALIPICGLVLLGFLLQRAMLRKHIISPIEALADTSVGNLPINPSWPREIQSISTELAKSFSNREQAIFGQLARGVIHDLKTYLNSMDIAIQLLGESEENDEKRKRALEGLVKACRRNLPKIQEVIDLSLDTAREVSLKPVEADLSIALNEAISTVKPIADQKRVSIVTSEIENLRILHDRVQMERVFSNLLKNAIEAAESTDSVRRVTISVLENKDSKVAIGVEDNGPGIKDPDTIFRPFKSTKQRGHGLGLFVSRKIVEAHGGSITASRSNTLGGARFTVTLPNREGQA